MRLLTLRMAICCAVAMSLSCQSASAHNSNFLAHAQQKLDSALAQYRTEPTNVPAAVSVARWAFEAAEFAPSDQQRAAAAERGIAAARAVVARSPTNAAAYYWLGMNLGQLARTKWLSALPMVKDITVAFNRALQLDETIDFGGPNRALGLLYRDAPGWPTSVGDKKKARANLERAVKISPEFPENQLCLLESYEKWNERTSFERQFRIAERVLQDGSQKFPRTEWASSWADWERRFSAMKAKAHAMDRPTQPKGVR